MGSPTMTNNGHVGDHLLVATATAEQREHYRSQGWLKVEGLVDPTTCAKLHSRIEARFGDLNVPNRYHEADPNSWFDDSQILDFWQTGQTQAFVSSLLCEDGTPLSLRSGGVFAIGPMTPQRTFWHQDAAVTPRPFGPEMCTAWLALSGVSATRAPLLVVPGSHTDQVPTFGLGIPNKYKHFDDIRWVYDEDASFPNAVAVEAKQGDAIFLNGWTIHASRPNSDTKPRVALTSRYRRNPASYHG